MVLDNPYLVVDILRCRESMNHRIATVTIIASLLITTLLFSFVYFGSQKKEYEDVYVGVCAAYDSVAELKTLVDSISPYTNVFLIGSTGITFNETKLNDLSQYIYDKGLSFIVYTDMHGPPQLPSRQWIESAKAKYGDRFLGLYVYDEVGGKHLDLWEYRAFTEADNYSDARQQFVTHLKQYIEEASSNATNIEGVQIFSSDYALYWFDYKAGYDTIFAEFGLNYSRDLAVSMCRGAAYAQDKDWGAMITWTYTKPPYLESGEELYDDMVFAYRTGAKYIIIFDTNENYTHGILGEEHFQAIKEFTQYAHKNPRTKSLVSEQTAFVLPKDFAFGFRGPTDRIWGLWEANSDPLAFALSERLGSLLESYGNSLDVIYDDEVDFSKLGYREILFWNGTILGG